MKETSEKKKCMRTVCAGDRQQQKANARKGRVRALEDREQTVRARRNREGEAEQGGVWRGVREREKEGGRERPSASSVTAAKTEAGNSPIHWRERERERENERERE